MKKAKNETALVRAALDIIMASAVKRGIVEFEPTDSHDDKIEYCYRLLVHDKAIIPLANDQLSLPNKKKRLATWAFKHLPDDHPLKK